MKTTDRRRSALPSLPGLPGLALVGAFVLTFAMIAGASADPIKSKGRIPDAAFRADGTIDSSLVPDYVSAYGRDGVTIAGYVPKEYLSAVKLPSASKTLPRAADIPVYGEDLTTLVGHMVRGKGFVPLGVDPATIPSREVEVGAE